MIARVLPPSSALPLLALLACGASPRDVVPDTPTETRTVDAGPRVADDAYVYVARRPHGAVGLAEARHMKDEEARSYIDRVADELERCAMSLDTQRALVEGAARLIIVAGPNGTPAVSVKLAPGDAVAQNALLCLVAPARASLLPSSQAALALEATWHPQ